MSSALPKGAARTARSAYVSRLRRAFLLRVHPDRFRNHGDVVRQNQAALVKALSNRMSQSDFITWQSSSLTTPEKISGTTQNSSGTANTAHYPYVLERRDGSLFATKLNLGDPVDGILNEMARALTASGAVAPASPSPMDSQTMQQNQQENGSTNSSNIFYAPNSETIKSYVINRKYDIVSNRGRNLKRFLVETGRSGSSGNKHSHSGSDDPSSPSLDEMIQERRSSRMDAQALALTVRKVFQFQSVDAIQSGWSSASVAVLLRRLLDVYEEHSREFKVKSFYPLRLVFIPTDFTGEQESFVFDDDDDNNDTHPSINIDANRYLDIYGGVLRLHPAWTSVQWLNAIQSVTLEDLEAVRSHRVKTEERSKIVAAVLGVKIRKGHSCSSGEYHSFLKRISSTITTNLSRSDSSHFDSNISLSMYSSSIALQANSLVVATIESSYAIRRPSTSKEGQIRLSANMDIAACRDAVGRLLPQAQQKAERYQIQQEQCKDAIHQVQFNLGVQKVYRASPYVTQDQFYDSLRRILRLVDTTSNNTTTSSLGGDDDYDTNICFQEERDFMKRKLAGNSLGIASEGQFCHLADDGSVVIPHNWMYTSTL